MFKSSFTDLYVGSLQKEEEEEEKHIHAGSASQNNVYIINLIFKSIRWFALRKVHMHAGSTHGSSVYLIKYVLVTPVCCCSVLGYFLGSGYCILVTTF